MKTIFLFFLLVLSLVAQDNWSEHRHKIMYWEWDSLHVRRNKFDSLWVKYINDSVLVCDTATIHKLKGDSAWVSSISCTTGVFDTTLTYWARFNSFTCTTATTRDSVRILGQLRTPTINCSLAVTRDSNRVLGFIRTPTIYCSLLVARDSIRILNLLRVPVINCTTGRFRDSIRTTYCFLDSGATIDSFLANIREDTIVRTWFTTTSKIYTQAIDSLVTPIWIKNSTGNGDTIFARMSTGINARVKYIWWSVKL